MAAGLPGQLASPFEVLVHSVRCYDSLQCVWRCWAATECCATVVLVLDSLVLVVEFIFQPAVWVCMILDMQHYGGACGVGAQPLLPFVRERFVFGFGASRPRTAQLPRGPGCCPSCTGLHDFCRQSSGATEVRGCLGPTSMVPFWHYHVQSRGTHGPSAQCRHLLVGLSLLQRHLLG